MTTETTFQVLDLETYAIIPLDAEDWDEYRPLRVTCAAMINQDWASLSWTGPELEDGRLADYMSPVYCADLADCLLQCAATGDKIVTWNGLGFDFKALCDELTDAEQRNQVIELALSNSHVDIAFHMLCSLGYMTGLDAACRGMNLGSKTENMTGWKAPLEWRKGREEQDMTIDYCIQDASLTAVLFKAIDLSGNMRWLNKRGASKVWSISGGLLGVADALRLPVPSRPLMARDKFHSWVTSR